MIAGKRGAGHIEVIMSLVLFVGFLLVIVYVINPFKISEKSVDYTNIVMSNVKNLLNANLYEISVNVNDFKGVAYCMHFSDISPDKNILVKDSKGDRIKAKHNENGIYMSDSQVGFSENINTFFTVYLSDEFSEEDFELAGCSTPADYKFGVYQKIDAISYSKLSEFNRTYWESYDNIKSEMGVSGGDDFGFSLSDSLGNIYFDNMKTRQGGGVVNVKEESIGVVYDTGEIKYLLLRVVVY